MPFFLPLLLPVAQAGFYASCSSRRHFYNPSQSFFCWKACQGPWSLGDNQALLAPGRRGAGSTTNGAGGSRSSPVGWRPKAALFQGSGVRRARMHWGGRGLESNTTGHPFPRQIPLNEPSFLLLFSHRAPVVCFLSTPAFLLGSRLISELHFPLFKPASLLILQVQAPKLACNCSSKPAFWRWCCSIWICGFPCSEVEKAIKHTSYILEEFSNL